MRVDVSFPEGFSARLVGGFMSGNPDVSTPSSGSSLKSGSLGALAIAFFVVSAAGPLVAMAGGIPVAMLFGNGAGIPAAFVVATLVLLAFSVGYTAMARHVQSAGAFYAFTAKGLGKGWAAATGAVVLLSYNAIQIGLYGLFGVATSDLIHEAFAVKYPWWVYAFVAWIAVAFSGYRQVDLSAKILGLLVAGEYLIIILIDVAIGFSGGSQGTLSYSSFAPEYAFSGAPAVGLMLCFAAFIGFEATTIYSEEARDPENTIPKATYYSITLIGVFYIVSTLALVNGIGIDNVADVLHNSEPTTVLFEVARSYVGEWVVFPMKLLFVTSGFASILAFHNAIARYFYALGREGLLPRGLGRTHIRYQSPHRGSLTQSVLALVVLAIFVLSGADPILTVFTLPSAIATLGVIVVLSVTALAIILFFSKVDAPPLPKWKLSAMAVSAIMLLAIAIFSSFNFSFLAGADTLFVKLLPLLIVAAAFLGVLLSWRLKSRLAKVSYLT